MAGVKIDRVKKVYPGNVVALHETSFDIYDKEFMVLVGPSGCGKSTTLRMIAGLEEITAGNISIGDRVINDVAPKDRDIAMVFQNYALYPHMTVYDNMAFGLKLRKVPKQEIRRKVTDVAASLGLSEYLERRPKALSGGQRQRVALGRAIVREPSVFLFDEPLSNLDAKMRVDMRKELSLLHRRLQTTIIYVTHDQIEAMTLGSRICVMSAGHVQQLGTPLEVYDFPKNVFVAKFIGTPPMNILEGTLRQQDGTWTYSEEGVNVNVSNLLNSPDSSKKAFLGIRPENIKLCMNEEEERQSQFSAHVEVVEKLGDEQLVYCRTKQNPFICKMESHINVEYGKEYKILMNMAKAHIFDNQENNITHRNRQGNRQGNR